MKSKYSRYREDLIENIACDIEENRFLSASEASQNYGLDASGLIKHIKKYRKNNYCKERCNSICEDFIETSICSRLLATALISPEILKLNDFRLIEPDEVNLHPSLVKKN